MEGWRSQGTDHTRGGSYMKKSKLIGSMFLSGEEGTDHKQKETFMNHVIHRIQNQILSKQELWVIIPGINVKS